MDDPPLPAVPSPSLTRAYSLYLDLVRFLAALAVLLDHLSSYPFSSDAADSVGPVRFLLGSYGASAVTVFFVLSGFVIAHVVAQRERGPRAYLVSRLSRLYSVVLPALVATALFDALGQALNPRFYAIQKVLWKPVSWQGYAAAAAYVNEYQVFGFNGIVPGSNSPFWSLSFEATYYLLAGLLLFARRPWAVAIGLLVLALAGRTIAALLPLWALGYGLYLARARLAPPAPLARALLLVSTGVLLALPLLQGTFVTGDNFGVRLPWGRGPFNRHLWLDYATAAAFAVHLLSAQRLLGATRRVPQALARTLRWLGATTFPMYAMHYPALCLVAALSPWPHGTPAHLVLVTLVVLGFIGLVTPLCERLKYALRQLGAARESACGDPASAPTFSTETSR